MNSSTRFWLILVAAVVLVTLLAGGAGSDGPPLDPRSVNPDGTRGVVETLERLGADVDLDLSVPRSDMTGALLIIDRLSGDDADLLDTWVRRGGTLVVTDPASRFAPLRSGFASPRIASEDCGLDWLDGTTITGSGRTFDAANRTSCFGDGSESYLTLERRGDGTVIALGGPSLLTNENLSQLDNAFVATTLLAPVPNESRIAVLSPSLVDFGDQSLNSLVATRVRNAILMLLASFGLYALFRMRRLGAVVKEPQPVPIRGSELVLQAGVLSQRAKDPASVAATIRADFARRWRRILAVEDDEPAQLARRIAAHLAASTPTGPDEAALLDALVRPVTTDDDVLEIVHVLDTADDPGRSGAASASPDPVLSDQREVSPRV